MATIRKLRGRWQAMIRRKGMVPRCKSFDIKTDAERWARSLEAEVDRAGFLPDTRTAETLTLGALLERYVKEITPSKRSARTEAARIKALLRRPLCHRTLALLSSSDLARYRDERIKEVAPATVIRELNTISHAIDTARREWSVYLPQNPCQLVRRPSAPRGRDRRLKDGEEQRLLAAADAGRNPFMRPLIILAIETAMRRSELLGMRWRDVDLDKRLVHLPLTKNGESRDVPLSTLAIAVLNELSRDQELVFPCSAGSVWQCWEHLRVRAGMRDLRFHDLRHEGVSRLFEKGLNVVEASAVSGHKELRMLARYAHLDVSQLAIKLG
jgi:integrase